MVNKSEKTDIWMPLYIGDYLADTQNLDAERSGAYLHLLMHYWRKGPIPNVQWSILSITKIASSNAWSIAQEVLMEFFEIGDDDLWHQTRADKEIAKWNDKHKKAKEKSKKAAVSRWTNYAPSNAPSNAQAMHEDMHKECPSPSPLPQKLSEAKASSPRRDANGDQSEPDEFIYREYPRKEGHGAAIRAIGKAISRLRRGETMPPMETREARVFLYKRVQVYARSPAGQRDDKTLIPHPSTWFNESRYLDDESNWNQLGAQKGYTGNGNKNNYPRAKTDGNVDAAREAIASILGDDADLFGAVSPSDSEQNNPGVILKGNLEVRTEGYLGSGEVISPHAPTRG